MTRGDYGGEGNASERANINISANRVRDDIERIAQFSEREAGYGYSRPTFSKAWRRARDYIIAEAEKAGGRCRIDAAGNLRIRHSSVGWDRRVWLVGSHLDSVPSGGKFDGVVGVVIPLELLRVCPGLPVELIVFTEEEGTTFGVGMLGSRALAGRSDAAFLSALKNAQGETYFEAGRSCGAYSAGIEHLAGEASAYAGMIEVHAEQGPGLWNAGGGIAVVNSISGRRQFSVHIHGQENHAGATAMTERKDALAAAAEAILYVETLAGELNETNAHTVMTVGKIGVQPNAANVISGDVFFTVDVRARSEHTLEQGRKRLEAELGDLAARRGVDCRLELTESVDPVALDAAVVARLSQAAAGLGLPLAEVVSGAVHDAAMVAPVLPTAMLFVASKDGISHSPMEFSRVEDIVDAARVLAEALSSR